MQQPSADTHLGSRNPVSVRSAIRCFAVPGVTYCGEVAWRLRCYTKYEDFHRDLHPIEEGIYTITGLCNLELNKTAPYAVSYAVKQPICFTTYCTGYQTESMNDTRIFAENPSTPASSRIEAG